MFGLKIKDLEGKVLKRAIKAIEKETKSEIREEHFNVPLVIAFSWQDSKQGHDYWENIHKNNGVDISKKKKKTIEHLDVCNNDYNSKENIDSYKAELIDLILNTELDFEFKNNVDASEILTPVKYKLGELMIKEHIKNCLVVIHANKLYDEQKGTPLIKAKKTEYKGKLFQSRLEVYMFKALEQAKIPCKYESESFTIIKPFFFKNDSYEKTPTSKVLVNKGNKNHLGITYKPDFIIENGEQRIIIECKGLATDVFTMRFKLFKKWISDNNKDYILFTPRNQSQCDFVIEKILQIINPPI